MKTSGSRLKYLIELEESNLVKFCENYNLSYGQLNAMINDFRGIGTKTLQPIIESHPDWNANWILFNIGEPKIIQKCINNEVEEPTESYKKEDLFKNVLIDYMKSDDIKNEIEKIVDKKVSEYQLLNMALEIGDENSEMFEKLDQILKNSKVKKT